MFLVELMVADHKHLELTAQDISPIRGYHAIQIKGYDVMQARNLFTALILCVAIGLPQYASAGRFCPVTDSGAIRIDECKYSTNEECKRVTGTKGDCAMDQPPASTKAPFCLIMGAFEVCDKYQDYESCEVEAKRRLGNCVINPYYENPDK
jgi:hypothetical protein